MRNPTNLVSIFALFLLAHSKIGTIVCRSSCVCFWFGSHSESICWRCWSLIGRCGFTASISWDDSLSSNGWSCIKIGTFVILFQWAACCRSSASWFWCCWLQYLSNVHKWNMISPKTTLKLQFFELTYFQHCLTLYILQLWRMLLMQTSKSVDLTANRKRKFTINCNEMRS